MKRTPGSPSGKRSLKIWKRAAQPLRPGSNWEKAWLPRAPARVWAHFRKRRRATKLSFTYCHAGRVLRAPAIRLSGDEGGVGAEPQKKKSESSKLSWGLLPIRFAQG